ncbi:MAG TPA: aminotransferase class V-fold PLP-dependent enzyme [Polyangiaceae bacterium]|nr:aminotransferase class V-fold PLP-dependent enzyme [Polyangiaceae bacterium]
MSKDALREASSQFSPRQNYLNTAAIGLPPRSVGQALHELTDRWLSGTIGVRDFDAKMADARASFARLVGVGPEQVTIGPAASALVGTIAASLPRGAEVLCADGDFTSLLFPFLERQQAGELSVRSYPLEALADAVNERTTLVAVSAVQSFDGRSCDFDAIEQACRRVGASSLIDATQAVGWLPLRASRFDYVVASGYKWLLSPRGVAFLSVAPGKLASLRPTAPSWFSSDDCHESYYGAPLRLARDARRLDGSPVWFSWHAGAEALAFIERIGIAAIHAHDVELSTTFLDRLGRPPSGSAIVSVPGERAYDALRAAGITASRRGGATRVSFHLHNTREDAVAAADAIRRGL